MCDVRVMCVMYMCMFVLFMYMCVMYMCMCVLFMYMCVMCMCMCVMCMCMCVMCMCMCVMCDVHVCDVCVHVQLVQMEVHISLLRKGYVRGGTSTLDLDQYATKVYYIENWMLVILYILNDDLHVHHVKHIS